MRRKRLQRTKRRGHRCPHRTPTCYVMALRGRTLAQTRKECKQIRTALATWCKYTWTTLHAAREGLRDAAHERVIQHDVQNHRGYLREQRQGEPYEIMHHSAYRFYLALCACLTARIYTRDSGLRLAIIILETMPELSECKAVVQRPCVRAFGWYNSARVGQNIMLVMLAYTTA